MQNQGHKNIWWIKKKKISNRSGLQNPHHVLSRNSVHALVMLSRTSISFCHLFICAWAHICNLKAKLQYTEKKKKYFFSVETRNTFSLSHFTSLMIIWALDYMSSNLHILFTKWSTILLIYVFISSLCPSPTFSGTRNSLQFDIISSCLSVCLHPLWGN